MAKSKNIFKIRDKQTGLFRDEHTWSKLGKEWKREAGAIAALGSFLEGFNSYSFQTPEYTDHSRFEILRYRIELVEEDVIEVEAVANKKKRIAYLRDKYGYRVKNFILRLEESNLLDFRYLILFTSSSFSLNTSQLQELLNTFKELGIKHGSDFRYTQDAFAFRDREQAVLARLSCPDKLATNVIDLTKEEEILPNV